MFSAELILNVAYVLLLGSTFARTVSWLRIMLAAGAVAFVVFGAIEGITSMVVWNIAIGGMHVVRLLRDYRQQRSVQLTPREQLIRDEFLPDLNDFDFNLLWAMGEQATYSDEILIASGTQPTTVSIVLEGTALIERNGELIRGVRRGGLLGEMSFVTGEPAGVSVCTKQVLTVHEWRQRDLESLAQLRPGCARAMERMIARDLAAKTRV
jgi:hypothetical protein